MAVIHRRWFPFIALACVVGTGCMNPASLAMLIAPFKDDKEPAKVPLTKKIKEPTVVIMASFANPLEMRPEFQTADGELCDKVAAVLKARFDQNRERIKIVPYYKVKAYLNEKAPDALASRREIGKHFKADYVVNLDINSLTFYKEKSFGQFFSGNTEISVTVFDVHQDDGVGPIHDEVYRLQYPDYPIPTDAMSVLAFRGLFLESVARDLSKMFAPYDSDEKYQMRSNPMTLP